MKLIFVRCTFEGGRITVDETIDRPIFTACLFQGTRFDRQGLSERIACECHWRAPPTEAAATPHPAPWALDSANRGARPRPARGCVCPVSAAVPSSLDVRHACPHFPWQNVRRLPPN